MTLSGALDAGEAHAVAAALRVAFGSMLPDCPAAIDRLTLVRQASVDAAFVVRAQFALGGNTRTP
jgi:hypothetical protein